MNIKTALERFKVFGDPSFNPKSFEHGRAAGFLEAVDKFEPMIDFISKCSHFTQPSTEDSKNGLLNWIITNGQKILTSYQVNIRGEK